MKQQPLIEGTYTLKRFEAKGGWTFISIPEILEHQKWKTGGIKIKGTIDDHVIGQLRLMRTGDMLFLPVNASIRKAIRKKAGDTIKVVFYEDETALVIPAEIMDCLDDEPKALEYFITLAEGYKREYINWINAGKQPETRARRIAGMIGKLLKQQTLSKPYEL